MKVLSTEVHIGLFLYVTTVILPVEVGGGTTCSCYTYKAQGFSWQISRVKCRETGGDLVAMETDGEWIFVKDLTQRKSTTSAGGDQWYIGLQRDKSSGNWTWVSGKPLTIQKWQPNMPDKDPSRNVAMISKSHPDGAHGLFENVDEKHYKAYICEKIETSDCNQCWIHPNRTSSTPLTTTSPRQPAETHISTEKETSTTITTAPDEGKATVTPQSSSKPPLVLILGVVLGVLFAVVVAVLGIFLFKRFRSSRKSPRTKGAEEQSRPLKDQGGNTEAIYHEAAKLLGTPKQEQEQTCTEVPEYDDVKNNTYAVVDKSKKKKREDKMELCYAELEQGDLAGSIGPTKPAPYSPTEYAEVVGTVTGSPNQSDATPETGRDQYATVA